MYVNICNFSFSRNNALITIFLFFLPSLPPIKCREVVASSQKPGPSSYFAFLLQARPLGLIERQLPHRKKHLKLALRWFHPEFGILALLWPNPWFRISTQSLEPWPSGDSPSWSSESAHRLLDSKKIHGPKVAPSRVWNHSP